MADSIMKPQRGFGEALSGYRVYLLREERSKNTIQKYERDLRSFFSFIDGRALTKELVLEWKKELSERLAPASVNSMLAALNGFLEWSGCSEFKVKPLRIQREIFRKPEKELTKREYERLVSTAQKQHKARLALLLQTICATGIRVSELRFVTVETLHTARAQVACKGKNRTIFLPAALCRALRRYCREKQIRHGVIFRTNSGRPLDRSNIWREMKELCSQADVMPEKVFPHNLRHLFARTYYRLEKDLARLADLLGHTSVSTTRIYTMESGVEHVRLLERLSLVLTGT